jgi:hypothetical protein
MAFSIAFPPDTNEEIWEGKRIRMGRITIGGFTEDFMAYLEYWSAPDYEAQWKDAIRRVVSGSAVEALITDMHDLRTAHHLVSWPMYREGARVFVQNRLLLLSNFGRPLQLDQLIGKLGNRQTINKDGQQISEWLVETRDLEIFLDQLK